MGRARGLKLRVSGVSGQKGAASFSMLAILYLPLK